MRVPTDLEKALGIDPNDPQFRLAQYLVEGDHQMIINLRGYRKRRGLTVEDVAERMGISVKAVRELESIGQDPRLSTLRRYCAAIGARVTHIVEDA